MTSNNNELFSKLVDIDHKNLVSMSNNAIENQILENYGAFGMKIIMIGVVGAYAIGKKNYDHRFFIKFSVENFASLIGKEEKYAISIFKKTCAILRNKEVILRGYLDGEETDFVTGLLDTYAYSKNEKSLAVKFNSEFVPFFMEMSGNFTQYELNYALKMKRVESISFYCFIKMKIGKEFKNIIKDKAYYFDIEEKTLRKFFNVEHSYTQARDLKNKILAKVAKEITDNTDLTIEFESNPKAGILTMSFKYKSESDRPSKISLDDFKLTKDKKMNAPKQVKSKKIDDSEKKESVVSESAVEKPQGDIKSSEQGTKSISDIFQKKSEIKKLSEEEIKTISNSFINDHSDDYNLIARLIDNGAVTFKKHPADFMIYILTTYNSRFGAERLKDYVKMEFSVKLQAFFNENKNSGAISLSSINMFYV